MGPSRANPLTGEIFDADIIFDASMVRFYRNEAHIFGGSGAATMMDADPISPIKAVREGCGLEQLDLRGFPPAGTIGKDKVEAQAEARWRAIQAGVCQCGPCMKRELTLAAMALAHGASQGRREAGCRRHRRADRPGDQGSDDARSRPHARPAAQLQGQHHAAATRTCTTTAITRDKGLSGSVMDYAPVNLAPKGVKQGDYFTTTLGPYDYWAIEYAYKPLSGGTDGEAEALQKIACKSATPGHDYATDEDLYSTSDPLVNVWDLGNDPMKFGQDRILLAEELIKSLADKASDKGEGYPADAAWLCHRSAAVRQRGSPGVQLRRRGPLPPRPQAATPTAAIRCSRSRATSSARR